MDHLDEFINRLECPNIVKFICTMMPPSDRVMGFIARHPTIKTMQLVHPRLEHIAEVAPGITKLTARCNPSPLYTKGNLGSASPIFKRLEYFALIDQISELSLEAFENIVTHRALPHRHPRSNLHPECQPLTTLAIGVASQALGQAVWTKSTLYRTAKDVKFEWDEFGEDMVYVTMNW
jgi:hypothetical protein